MNRTRLLLTVAITVLLGACAINDGHPALVRAADPHATLQELLQGNIDDDRARVTLVRIDGRRIVEGNRRTFLLEPGAHTLGFTLDVESLAAFESGIGERYPDPSSSAASVNEKTLEVTLEEGKHYTFGAAIEEYNYAGWEPFVVETDDLR